MPILSKMQFDAVCADFLSRIVTQSVYRMLNMGVSRKVGSRPDIGDRIVCMRHGYLHLMRTISASSTTHHRSPAPAASRARLGLVAGLNDPVSYGFESRRSPVIFQRSKYPEIGINKGAEHNRTICGACAVDCSFGDIFVLFCPATRHGKLGLTSSLREFTTKVRL